MVAVNDHTYGHLLQMGMKLVTPAPVKVVGVSHLLLVIITTVSQDTMALIALLQSCTPVILSGMVQGART